MSTRTIRVMGEAELLVAPDVAVVLLEVRAEEKSVAKSRALIEEQSKSLRAALLRAGLEAKDVQVDRLATGPRSNGLLSYKSSRDDGSSLQRLVAVTVRDVARYEEVLVVLLESGARVKGVEFQSAAIRHHRGEARTSALVAAREKAQAMAAVMSKKIDDVVSIEERAAATSDESFTVGSIVVRASVEVTFSLS